MVMMRRHAMVQVAVIDAGVLCLLFAATASGEAFTMPQTLLPMEGTQDMPQPLLSEAGAGAAMAGGYMPPNPEAGGAGGYMPPNPEAGGAAAAGGRYYYTWTTESAPSFTSTPAADATAPKDESYGAQPTLIPATPSQPSSPVPSYTAGGQSSATPATPSQPSSPVPSYTAGGQSSATPAAASEPANGLDQKAIDDIVREHNVFRAREHVPPLSWNATLARFAQQYAETLNRDKGCQMVHSKSQYGENLMLASGEPLTWKRTVDDWSDEKRNYHYGSNTCDPGKMCGHYTAVVWKGTTGVGCGRVKCNNGDTMEVCSYWPPGNYIGVKPY